MVSTNTQSSGEYLLEMTGVNKSFPGVKALDNVNLKVRPHSIHALMGENGAGKSTLLKCLFGIYQKDSGSILFQGKEIDFHSAKEALENGISMVHQELNLVLQRSVMDNMWLGRYPTKGVFVDQDKMYRDTKAIFDELDIDIDPRARVGTLSVSQMQMIEIAKAFSYDAKIVIMDEPTSSLTEKEVNHLFTIIRKLKDRGCGIVYISHKMEEIFQLCDEITILRDGQWIATQPLEGLDMDKIIAMMVGRSLNQRFPDKENKPGEVILEVRNLTSLRQPSIRDVSFDLHKGETLGSHIVQLIAPWLLFLPQPIASFAATAIIFGQLGQSAKALPALGVGPLDGRPMGLGAACRPIRAEGAYALRGNSSRKAL